MKNYKKLKSFESYMGAGDDVEPVNNKLDSDLIKSRIKTILEGVIETKMYFQMLKDSAENCYQMIQEAIPVNSHAFANELYERNEFLAELLDEMLTTLNGSSMIDDVDEIIENIDRIETLTEDNWDNVLSGENGGSLLDDDDDDEYDSFEEEDEGEEQDIPEKNINIKDDSKDQHDLPIEESKKNIKDLENIVKKYRKTEKFMKGDVVYLGGITTAFAKKLNGKKAEIVKKTEDKEECYDLFVSSMPFKKKGEANIKGMPAKFFRKEKVEESVSFRNKNKSFEGLDNFYQGEKHKIKIIKCDNPQSWYINFINQEFIVVEDDSGTKWKDGKEKWKVVPDNRVRGVSYINKDDTKIIG